MTLEKEKEKKTPKCDEIGKFIKVKW